MTRIIGLLGQAYPDAQCELNFKSPLQLLVAAILSAQCTDARVNTVTKELFQRYKTARDFADAHLAELERAVRPTGFFRNKAKNIKNTCQALVAEHRGKVPPSMAALVKLPGVARKTANVILGTAFGIASGIVVDTHVYRVAHRLGLSRQKDPNKVEQDLIKIVPRDQWIAFSHQAVLHGRYTCLARRPKCTQCLLYNLCESEDKVA